MIYGSQPCLLWLVIGLSSLIPRSPDKIYDFAASSKELEKKEQAARLAALQRQRRHELAAVVKAVENEARSL